MDDPNMHAYGEDGPDGERVASATNELRCRDLAGELNSTLRRWAERVGFDAVLG